MAGAPKKRARKLTAAQQRAAETKAQEASDAALEREERLTLVVELLLAGADARGVHRTARAEGWQLERADVDVLIADARDEMLADSGTSREELVRAHLAKLDNLYRRAFRAQDYRAATAILKEQRDLLGLGASDAKGAAATPESRARPLPEWQRER